MDKRFLNVLQQPINALTVLFAVSFCFFMVSLIGSFVTDDPYIHQESWIKLTKFSISFCTYSVVMMWLANSLFKGRRLFQHVARLACIGAIVELAVLYLLALLSINPHWNSPDLQNAAMIVLRTAILPPTALIALTFFLLLKDKITPPVMRSGLLWATSLALVGCVPAVLMLLPNHTAEQSLTHSAIPLLGWRTTGGDLRIAHFIGIHALQVMPIISWVAMKCGDWLTTNQQLTLVSNVGFMLLSSIILLTAQALMGETLFAPNVFTLCAIAMFFVIAFLVGMPIVRSILISVRIETR